LARAHFVASAGRRTVLILLPLGVFTGRWLAFGQFRGKGVAEAMLALPLVLPPTVLGFYLLEIFGGASPLGQAWQALIARPLVFSSRPGARLCHRQCALRHPADAAGFEAIPAEVREAAACSGLSPWRVLWIVDLPLAWPGIVTGLVLTFAHTLGEFGVVLMVGGASPARRRRSPLLSMIACRRSTITRRA